MIDQHLECGWNDEQSGSPTVLERIENAVGRELCQHDCRQPRRHRHYANSGTANVRARHGNQNHLVIVPFSICVSGVDRMLAQCEQIPVG